MLTTARQLEGIDNIRKLNSSPEHWGFADTPYGRMYIAGNDDGIAMRYFHGYEYESISMALWTRSCANAKIAVDVGAHTGIYTLAAYKAGAQMVISVEPYFLNAARLVMNLHANRLPIHNVAVFGASDHKDIAELVVPQSRSGEYYCTTAGNLHRGLAGRTHTIRLRSLDSFVKGRVDALKIDAEFHTGPILDGATELLKAQPDILLESFESGLTERLAALGYRFWLVDERDGLHVASTLEPQEMDEFRRNYFCSVREAPAELMAS